MNDLAKDCTDCGQCADICLLLADIGKSPDLLAKQGVATSEAFSCSLCGACEAVCPQGLSPKAIFAAGRKKAVSQNGIDELDINEYRYLFPDRKNNVLNVYREFHGIDYSDLENSATGGTWFFPGCILLTYSPGLTREIYRKLQNSRDCRGIWTDCCSKPLSQMGLEGRAEVMQKGLLEFLQQRKINEIIMACPGCYYEFKKLFSSLEVNILTVYETLDFAPDFAENFKTCTIHDACPDRFEGKFGEQVRRALTQKGYYLKEMEHRQERAICCGSGGQISHFNPELTEKLVNLRLDEARRSNADILVAYCLSCVLKFDGKCSEISATHALNLLLNQDEDFKGAKKRASQMLSGEEGSKVWEKIMADD